MKLRDSMYEKPIVWFEEISSDSCENHNFVQIVFIVNEEHATQIQFKLLMRWLISFFNGSKIKIHEIQVQFNIL